MLKTEKFEATHAVATIISHSKYTPLTYNNDIALIKLQNPIKFTKYILPACLPDQEFAEKVKYTSICEHKYIFLDVLMF